MFSYLHLSLDFALLRCDDHQCNEKENNKILHLLSFLEAGDVIITKLPLKADSHSLQRSADSAVDCVNAEIGIFLSLRSNATICRRRTRKMQ